ncbi:ABC-type multidrug transport system fused ATPase/permease subunit [Evansella vedderi]|uniref:ABC-type multidrug transport system fused ATPase/permease subunit n=1 Tax=Evansella vedderi TaxID=38282 RepID=A0ABU0A174_9BACI|nr:YesL family protein [Evansella vedderi]MDQ0257238.1 ABC-type multidrug transport system fused ATPase/permease subunit [Evansella vedderi]
MKNALTVFHRSVYDTYQSLGVILWSTILWWLSVLPIITLGPATAGLFYVINRKRNDVTAGPRDFWYGMKKYFWIGIQLSFLYLFVAVPGLSYFFILLTLDSFFTYFTAMIILYILVMWHLLMVYTMPFLVEQNITKISTLLKRSLRLVAENYMFTINIALYMVIITLVCSIITIMLVIWAGWMAVTAYNSLLYLLNKYEPNQYQFDPEVHWKGSLRPWKK